MAYSTKNALKSFSDKTYNTVYDLRQHLHRQFEEALDNYVCT